MRKRIIMAEQKMNAIFTIENMFHTNSFLLFVECDFAIITIILHLVICQITVARTYITFTLQLHYILASIYNGRVCFSFIITIIDMIIV